MGKMWIKGLSTTENHGAGLPVFYRQFRLEKPLTKCVMEISALGIFAVKINGLAIEEYFMPGWSNYHKYVNLCQYDITKLLAEDNLLEITLADGWYAGRLGYHKGPYFYGYETALYVKITLTYQDGSVLVIDGDRRWKVGNSNVLSSSFFDGETMDFRVTPKELSSLPAAGECDLNVALQPYTYQPVKQVATLAPKVLYRDASTLRLDFGQNLSGFLNFTVKGRAGTRVSVRHAEVLNADGTLYYDNLRAVKAEDVAILSGEEDRFNPTFTFHGFRYAEITWEGDVCLEDIKAVAISQALDYHGEFGCSDEIVNKIYQNVLWGQLDNFISIPMDCPQRDERLGWTGDAQVFCNSAMFNADCKDFFANYLKLIRTDVLDDGRIPSLAPFIAPIGASTAGVPGWADAICVIPYIHYLHYRDKEVLKENLPYAVGHLEYYLSKSENYLSRVENPFGDWLSVKRAEDREVISQCFLGLSALLISKMYDILENPLEAGKYADIFEKAKRAFREHYLQADGKIVGDSQTIYALSLSVGFVTADEIKAPFKESVARENNRLTTGFIGVKYLLPALCEIGEVDLAYKIIKETAYPSWGYTIENGATTIWERWNGYTKENGFETPSMNSFNHYSLGSCVEWLYSHVLGMKLSADKPICISPSFSKELSFANGAYKTAFGKVQVKWKYEKNAYHVSIEAEKGVEFTYDFGDREILSLTKTEHGLRAMISE